MKNSIYKFSLIPGMIACMMFENPAICAIKNTSRAHYAEAYNQVNAVRQQQEYYDNQPALTTTTSATPDLPVRVANKELAAQILNNSAEDIDFNTLDSCAMIYPSGKFEWNVPESGLKARTQDQCVAVVELRSATDNTVLATTTLAAGDSMKCNIDSFPEANILQAAGRISFPADKEPTLEDVEKVMNEEQKQNAGLKIAATAIIGGIAANMLSPKEAGDTKLLGTGKQQLIGTALGAAGAAGVAAASSYSGKVAGDTIQSVAVNATAGMVVGNMTAGASGNDSTIKITKCKVDEVEHDCIWGRIQTGTAYTYQEAENNDVYLINASRNIVKCKIDSDNKLTQCKLSDSGRLTRVILEDKTFEEASKDSFEGIRKYEESEEEEGVFKATDNRINDKTYFLVTSATQATKSTPAFAVADSYIPNKAFGYTMEKDWEDLKSKYNFDFYARRSDNTVGTELTKESLSIETNNNIIDFFTAASLNADDGALVDLSNKGRAKGTMAGAAVGGAMGGFSSYQGAKSEVVDRWTEAVREYKDSLTTIYCATGTRFLATYNDIAQIDPMKTE